MQAHAAGDRQALETIRRPIRVLHVLTRLNVGGPARQLLALSNLLDPASFETHIVAGTLDSGEADLRELLGQKIDAHEMPGLQRSIRPLEDARTLRALSRHIADVQPDVVHTHLAKAGLLGRIAARRVNVPAVIHSFHGHLLYGGYFPRPMTKAVTLIEARLARRTTLLLTEGARVRDELLAAGVGCQAQYIVVPPGVTVSSTPSRLDARRALDLPPDSCVIGFVGRLAKVKRPDRLLEVAADLGRRFRNLILVVAGGGPLLDVTVQQARQLAVNVRFLGWRGDIENVYAAADVVLLTSDNEGMPYSLAEAAMVGTPSVATDVGSTAEVVIHGVTGFVTACDHHALAEAAARLLKDPQLRARMGVQARSRAESLFSESRMAMDIGAAYLRALGSETARE